MSDPIDLERYVSGALQVLPKRTIQAPDIVSRLQTAIGGEFDYADIVRAIQALEDKQLVLVDKADNQLSQIVYTGPEVRRCYTPSERLAQRTARTVPLPSSMPQRRDTLNKPSEESTANAVTELAESVPTQRNPKAQERLQKSLDELNLALMSLREVTGADGSFIGSCIRTIHTALGCSMSRAKTLNDILGQVEIDGSKLRITKNLGGGRHVSLVLAEPIELTAEHIIGLQAISARPKPTPAEAIEDAATKVVDTPQSDSDVRVSEPNSVSDQSQKITAPPESVLVYRVDLEKLGSIIERLEQENQQFKDELETERAQNRALIEQVASLQEQLTRPTPDMPIAITKALRKYSDS